jgi:hypothetical protein
MFALEIRSLMLGCPLCRPHIVRKTLKAGFSLDESLKNRATH